MTMSSDQNSKAFSTLGMFILDRFEYLDEQGQPTGRETTEQIGGGGTYAAVGCRMWLAADRICMTVDRGHDFPQYAQEKLNSYGAGMWRFRDGAHGTTRALNLYRGDVRGFEYLTPRIRITPKDLAPENLSDYLHFICSPARAKSIMDEVDEIEGWHPTTIYEPIPDRCVPEELPALRVILPKIDILSPNAMEALTILSMSVENVTREMVEDACLQLLAMDVGKEGKGAVIIRSGELGAYVKQGRKKGLWIDAYWGENRLEKVVDVTGAGNAFLGGLAAGLALGKNLYEAVLYATVSASFTIEQYGLPPIGPDTLWNGDSPQRRVEELQNRYRNIITE